MSTDEFVRRYPDYEASPEQIHASRYLEKQGSRFLIDHGFQNAPTMAWKLINRNHHADLEYDDESLQKYKELLLLGIEP